MKYLQLYWRTIRFWRLLNRIQIIFLVPYYFLELWAFDIPHVVLYLQYCLQRVYWKSLYFSDALGIHEIKHSLHICILPRNRKIILNYLHKAVEYYFIKTEVNMEIAVSCRCSADKIMNSIRSTARYYCSLTCSTKSIRGNLNHCIMWYS